MPETPRPLRIAEQATLVHGYTMADVERAAQTASRHHRRSLSLLDMEDREEIAWGGIVEYLYECGCGRGVCNRRDDVSFRDLVLAGIRSLDYAMNDTRRHNGFSTKGGEAANFIKFWLPVRRAKHWSEDGFSDRLCDLMVLRESLGELTDDQYETIATLAAFDGIVRHAANALGVNERTFYSRVTRARARVHEVWVDELPDRSRVADDGGEAEETCGRGHSRAQHGKQTKAGHWRCTECQRAYDREWKKRKRHMAAEDAYAALQAEGEALAAVPA